MLDSLSLPILLLIFGGAAAVVWVAGTYLSGTTDILADRFNLGQALGGIIMLAIVTNLPEIAITVSASLSGQVELAVGNLLGGVALQTVVLALLDLVGVGKKGPLTRQVTSLTPMLEGCLVVAMLTVVVMGHQLPASLMVDRVSPTGLLLVAVWVGGVFLIGRARQGLPWTIQSSTNGKKTDQSDKKQNAGSTTRTIIIFCVAALATLVGGVALEESGDAIAGKIGMSGVLFGATVLAAATSLPEVSTGLASLKTNNYELAISDIFGGNAFLPVLFPLATALSGKAVLPTAHKSDMYLTGLGILLTVIYLYGILFRSKKQVARMGLDSLFVLIAYGLAIGGLFFVGKG